MPCIVIDDRRGDRPKAARRFAVGSESPSNSVALLVRATSPACTTLLAERLSEPILVGQCHVIWL